MVTTRAFDEIIDFLTSCPKPAEVVAFKPSPKMQGRVSRLLEKKQEGKLTDEESQELEYFMIIEHMMRLAKARARKRLVE
jgi:hypothetical protein